MSIQGTVRNGVVVLESGAKLPEGTRVSISTEAAACARGTIVKAPGQLPIVQGGKPGSLALTNERIAEILDDEDMESLGPPYNVSS